MRWQTNQSCSVVSAAPQLGDHGFDVVSCGGYKWSLSSQAAPLKAPVETFRDGEFGWVSAVPVRAGIP